ncbi:R3H domain-containing nucleic acid-binding protein [Homoserinimonas sp. OAct 916]|uniref:Jag family protein n=1 Tax=Homoserinimonas sp. OAct 916 TaxID=2211450 RepID=UPI000DBE61A6|nr:R3H domain-containing nucleic acid-binding protein [Homoserinimonas sp. OAct 916]
MTQVSPKDDVFGEVLTDDDQTKDTLSVPTRDGSRDADRVASTVAEIEEEGDIAADYIEEFLDICDIDGDIDIEARPGRAYVAVNAPDNGNLGLLSRPDTVNALQELTRLAVQSKNGKFSRLILDIGGSREAREKELSHLVDRAIARIEEGAAGAALPAMTSYERKIVHDLVAARGYHSASEGAGNDRHTVISASQ